MKLTNIFISGLFLLVSTTLNFAQAQVDPDERFSSSVYMSLQLGANTDVLAHETTNRSSPSVLSKGGAGLNVGPNVLVSDPFNPTQPGGDLRGRSETTIASDPSGQNLLVGWNDAEGFLFAPFGPPPALGLSGFAFSGDGGQTWTDAGAPFVFGSPGIVTRGDPWMDTGGPGQKTYYYANLAIAEDASVGGISVHRGKFTGNNFAFNNAVFIPAPSPGDFLDKESLCAGKNNQTKDWVVVATTNFGLFDNGAIDAFISNDRAATFTRTIVQPAEGAPLNQGTDCAISQDGKIYVVWERGRLSPFLGQFGVADPEIYIARSDNGGGSFTPRILVSAISSGSLFPPGGYNRDTHNDFPRIAVANAGPFKGRVYVVYNDSRLANGGVQTPPTSPFQIEDIPAGLGVDVGHWDLDVYLRFSDDMGVTWSSPTLVAGGGDGIIQFWPVVSTDANGRVNVTYNESAETTIPDFLNGDGFGTSLVDVFYTGSQDGGASFSTPQVVTEVTTDWGATPTNIAPNFGDYIFHVSKSNRVMVTWADGRSLVQPEVFYATIGVGLKKEGSPLAGSLTEDFTLNQNYPNPFNPETNITFTLPEDSRVTFKVYDILGREVSVLALGDLTVGQHRFTFDANDLPSGVYIYKVTAGNFVDSKKMILLK